jgi:hypothetical protein
MLRRRLFLLQLSGCFTMLGSGCGTVLHRERIGQPHSNNVDWEIAALNGLGLAFFFVPGVVAFAVDFYNGTIYLPQSYASTAQVASQKIPNQPPQPAHRGAIESAIDLATGVAEGSVATLRRLFLQGRERFSPHVIESHVGEEVGQEFSLLGEEARVSQLSRLDQFTDQCRAHHRDPGFGIPSAAFFANAIPA